MYPCAQVPKVGQKLTGRQRALSSLSLLTISSSSSRFLSRPRRRRPLPPPVHPQTPAQSHTILSHMPPCLTTNMALD